LIVQALFDNISRVNNWQGDTRVLSKTKVALTTGLVLAALSPVYADQDDLDEAYARSHPVIVPGTPPGITTSATAYDFAPSSSNSFDYHLAPHARRTHKAR
jgi:hypothetical protein